MSYTDTEDELLLALQDPQMSVVALVGKWGTGKTHLWRSAATRLNSSQAGSRYRQPVLISLFGVRRLSELKLQIIQNSLLDEGKLEGAQPQRGAHGAEFAQQWSAKTAVGATDADMASFSLPAHALDRLIVIDDVERKHRDLSIEELLGFINIGKERWGTRFLLLLNTDRLEDTQEVWHTLYEKVIDRQVVLNPTSREALEVAFLGRSDPSAILIAPAVERLGITNVRVIRRIAEVASRVIDATQSDSPSLVQRIIPSVVLMSAIHYRALKSAPSLEYVAHFNQLAAYMASEKKSAQELQWDDLIRRVGVKYPGEFERILQRYLDTGHLERVDLERFVLGLHKESSVSEVLDEAHAFLLMARWDISRKPADVIAQAGKFLTVADQLPAYLVGAIAQAVGENGGQQMERSLVDACLQHFDTLVLSGEANPEFFNSPVGQLHPRLRDRANKFAEDNIPKLSLIEAVTRVAGKEGWGDAERKVLTRASPDDFIEAMNAASPADLMQMINGLLRWMKGQLVTPETDAAHATFLLAARQVVGNSPYSLLARLLIREFTMHSQPHKLKPTG